MKTLYRGPLYRVIHSTEEEAECLADGWLPTPEDGKQYIVHTAIPAPTSCFAPSNEAAKREAPIVPPISASEYHALNHDTLPGAPPAGFCPEPESRTDAQSVMQMSATEYAELTDSVVPSGPVEPKRKFAVRKPARIVKPNDAEVKALG